MAWLSFTPLVHKKNKMLDIVLKGHEKTEGRTVRTTFVLDFNSENEVIGVEIINLRAIAGPSALSDYAWKPEKPNKEMRVSYDEDADAFYVSLSSERSINQGAVDGTLVLDSAGCVVRIECDLSDSEEEQN